MKCGVVDKVILRCFNSTVQCSPVSGHYSDSANKSDSANESGSELGECPSFLARCAMANPRLHSVCCSNVRSEDWTCQHWGLGYPTTYHGHLGRSSHMQSLQWLLRRIPDSHAADWDIQRTNAYMMSSLPKREPATLISLWFQWQPQHPMEGPILVTGGAGFFGYHLLAAILQEPGCRPIVSINRNPKSNLHDNVDYRAGSITDENFIRRIFDETNPRAIFHVAAPTPESDWPTARTHVDGTRVLLKVAAECPSVKAFVYTSSVGVAAGMLHRNIDESAPTWKPDARCSHYHKSKSIAEREILVANCKDMRTVSLRLCLIIGERDVGFIRMCADMLESGGTGYQIGPNLSLFCSVSAENAAVAHVLAAKALMDSSRPSQKVDGEAFNITDGNPMPFWDLPRIAWRAAGHPSDLHKATVIPSWAAYTIATVLEVLYAVFTFGLKSPAFKRSHVDYMVLENTYNIDKAKRVLGYRPVVNTHEVLKQSMEWELKKREQEKASKKL